MSKWVSVSEMVSLGYGCKSTILEHIHTGTFKCGNPGGGKWIVDLESYEEWMQQESKKPKRRHRYKARRKF